MIRQELTDLIGEQPQEEDIDTLSNLLTTNEIAYIVDAILEKMADTYKTEEITTIDGVKIDFESNWVHLRKSNTEPIIRIYTEAATQDAADSLANTIIGEIKQIAGL